MSGGSADTPRGSALSSQRSWFSPFHHETPSAITCARLSHCPRTGKGITDAMNDHAPPYSPHNMAAPQSDGLQVVDNGDNLPQVVDGFTMKPAEGGYNPATAVEEKKICGLRRTTFIMAVIMILVIIAAAVGGGVGGSKAVSGAYE